MSDYMLSSQMNPWIHRRKKLTLDDAYDFITSELVYGLKGAGYLYLFSLFSWFILDSWSTSALFLFGTFMIWITSIWVLAFDANKWLRESKKAKRYLKWRKEVGRPIG